MPRHPLAGAAAWSTTGADGSHADVNSTASENSASVPNTLIGTSGSSGTSARITVTTARFARPLNPATRSGLMKAASAAPDDETAPPAPMPPTSRPATTTPGAGARAAAPKPAAATTRPTRATSSRCGPALSFAVARPVTAVRSSAPVMSQLAVSTSTPSADCAAAIMYGERFTPR